jgi:AraC-like DNA-binding protein
MNQVNSVIDKNYKNSEFNIHLLAENMNMSRTNFYRKFLNITDVSPKEYLTKFRLNKAIELIHKGTDNFGDISFMCGFNNQSIFSVSFKREKGITPLQYKKSL